MTSYPNPSEPDTATRLAAWLSAHMAHTKQSAAAVAKELGVSTATVRAWLGEVGRHSAGEINEFAHLDTPAKLGAWLRVRIADSGCSVRQIAESTDDVSMGTIYNWLKGEPLPPPPTGDEPDRFDLLLRNPRLGLDMRQRVQLDEIRRRLTGTSLQATEPDADWSAPGLPADNRSFTGRRNEIKQLDRLLRDHAHHRVVVISALTGIGGVGKTALTVHWARTKHVKATFPDGCLYLDLNGYADSPPMPLDVAVTKLLYQLGVDPAEIPADPDARAARYQEALAGRRLLVILDNAHAEPQVRPLLPTHPDCLAIITSRNTLHGLDVTNTGITHLPLDTLTAPEAASLLRILLGRLATKTTSDEDINALAKTCGNLPLALQIAAAGYLTNHHPNRVTISEYTAAITEDRLNHLAIGPTDPATSLTATMNGSYQHLTDDARQAYRLLALHPGPDFTAPATASLTALPLARARSLLTELVQANLLSQSHRGRYAFHDLIRDHAGDLARDLDSGQRRQAATGRMLDYYLHASHTAELSLAPTREPISLTPPRRMVTTETFVDFDQAMAWFTGEHEVLMAAIDLAADTGFDVHAWQLAWTLVTYLERRGHWHDWVMAGRAAVAAADRLAEPSGKARTQRFLGHAFIKLRRFEEARHHLDQALPQFRAAEDQVGQAHTHHTLAVAWGKDGRYAEALDHAREALGLYRAVGHQIGEGHGLNAVGWLHALLGEHEQARNHCEQALDLYRKLGDLDGLAATWDSLGYIHRHLGHHTDAISCYRHSHKLFRDLGDHFAEATALTRLGDIHHATGDPRAARDAWRESLDILTELDHPDAAGVQAKLTELEAV